MSEKEYSVSEAIVFLKKHFGDENMPKSEETLRRAIRTNSIEAVRSLGREGSRISEKALLAYGEERVKSIDKRRKPDTAWAGKRASDTAELGGVPLTRFVDVYKQYISGSVPHTELYIVLIEEKSKWEQRSHEFLEKKKRLEQDMQRLENEISLCYSEIEAFSDYVKKLNS